MFPEEFERLVQRAWNLVPDEFRNRMHNIALVVEPEPSAEQLASAGVRHGTLLGLYEGRPLTIRSVFDSFAMPDRITIFQGPMNGLRAGRSTW